MPVLSRVQQNDIYEIATEAGLEPADFTWKVTSNTYVGSSETITHLPTQSHCTFGEAHEGKVYVSWWPKFRDGEPVLWASGWAAALPTVRYWIAGVKENHDAPNLWAEAAKVRSVTDAASDVEADNTPFTREELDALKPKLDEIQAFIASRQPLDERRQHELQGRFRYLLGAAKRGMGRIDWLNIFVGQVFQMFVDGMLQSSLFGEVMRHAATALGTILRVGTKLLGS